MGKCWILDAAIYPAHGIVKQIPDRTGCGPPTCTLHGWDDASDFGYGVNMPSHDVDSSTRDVGRAAGGLARDHPS